MAVLPELSHCEGWRGSLGVGCGLRERALLAVEAGLSGLLARRGGMPEVARRLGGTGAQLPPTRLYRPRPPAAEHVKEKWAKDLYIAGIAYGRTVT